MSLNNRIETACGLWHLQLLGLEVARSCALLLSIHNTEQQCSLKPGAVITGCFLKVL